MRFRFRFKFRFRWSRIVEERRKIHLGGLRRGCRVGFIGHCSRSMLGVLISDRILTNTL